MLSVSVSKTFILFPSFAQWYPFVVKFNRRGGWKRIHYYFMRPIVYHLWCNNQIKEIVYAKYCCFYGSVKWCDWKFFIFFVWTGLFPSNLHFYFGASPTHSHNGFWVKDFYKSILDTYSFLYCWLIQTLGIVQI